MTNALKKTPSQTMMNEVSLSANNRHSLNNLFSDYFPDLLRVEAKIEDNLVSEAQSIAEISQYLLRLGGKRIRPVMAIMAEKLLSDSSSASEPLICAASGIELIHMATLLHDDIIDKSPTRRSRPSAYKKYGLSSTLLAGDFLLVKAFGLCAKLHHFIISETEAACIALTEGEELEGHINTNLLHANDPALLDSYYDIIGKKTASLFALAMAVGAHCAGAAPDLINELKEIGKQTGLLFQMVDDILDITADEDLLGKPTGTDLRQKTPSLVNILWLQSKDSKSAFEFFSQSEISALQAKEVAKILVTSDIVTQARETVACHADSLKQRITSLTHESLNKNVQEHLVKLVSYTVTRSL